MALSLLPDSILEGGPLTVDPSGQSASGDLPSLQPLTDWLAGGGFSLGNGGNPTVLGTTQTPTPAPSQSPSFWGQINPLSPNFNPAQAGNTAAGGGSTGFLGLPTVSQAVAVVIGIVFIAGGLFLLSKGPAVDIITSSAKKLATGA